MTLAPVSIGNSIRGTENKIISVKDGCRIIGRDLAFSLQATSSSINDWTPVGGVPLTPAAFSSATIRGYTQIFNKFKINRIAFHYITNSSTAQAGDVMFYHEKNRSDPFPDFTNSNFLPVVLSDANTVIGPQWTNHSVEIKPVDSFNSTDYGTMFSKTPTANSPGYVLMDYDITFKELSISPRAGLLPNPRIPWYCTSFGVGSSSKSAGDTFALAINGNNYMGTQATAPSGISDGEIYKVIFDITNSHVVGSWTNCTNSNLVAYRGSGGDTRAAVTLDDGFTCYCCYTTASTVFTFYPTLIAALADSNPLVFNVTATIGVNLLSWVSLVSARAQTTQSRY